MANKRELQVSSSSGRIRPVLVCLFVFLGALALVGAYFIQKHFDDESRAASVHADSGIYINEIMSQNRSAVRAEDGTLDDWVEIINTSAADVSLNGWMLTDSVLHTNVYMFPDVTLAPGATFVVSCAGKAAAGDRQAAFKLRASGESLYLYDRLSALADMVSFPALGKNEVYARDPASLAWRVSAEYTPGLANTTQNYEMLLLSEPGGNGPLYITEVMPANDLYLREAGKDAYDYIEIYNASQEPFDLTGCALTDNSAERDKWIFSAGTLAPGEYRVIFAAGKGTAPDDRHTGFALARAGGTVELIGADGAVLDRMTYVAAARNTAFSRQADGTFTDKRMPSPGYANDAEGIVNAAAVLMADIQAGNRTGVSLNEAVASTAITNLDKRSYDWVEIVNSTAETIDLTGYGLSDNPAKPRRWTFPTGATIAAGQYMLICLSGQDRLDETAGIYHANFQLGLNQDHFLTLSDAAGTYLDVLPVGMLDRGDVSCGRTADGSLAFFDDPTPGTANTTAAYRGIAAPVVMNQEGGVFAAGTQIELSMTADPGTSIYYTVDCAAPDVSAPIYDQPLTITGTTIVRGVARREGYLSSLVTTESFLIGVEHTMEVVSLVADPDDLFGADGIYVNYTSPRQIPGAVEVFSADGETLLSQEADLALFGSGTRKYAQKAFKLTARSAYGDSKFRAPLFAERPDYEEYKSFLLRASGQDTQKTRMRDSVLSALMRDTGVMYQETTVCVVYLNGEYWGHYNMRERINLWSIARFMGWDDPQNIDYVELDMYVKNGSRNSYTQLLEDVKKNGVATDEALADVEAQLDIDNYFKYVAFNIYIANNDLGNVKYYRNANQDGKWRFIIYDVDLSFATDTDSMTRWMTGGGVGSVTQQDNTIFAALMKNDAARARFLTIFGQLLADNFSTANVMNAFQTRYDELLPEMPATFARWSISESKFAAEVKVVHDFALTRTAKIIDYTVAAMKLTDAEKQTYFGKALAVEAAYQAQNAG